MIKTVEAPKLHKYVHNKARELLKTVGVNFDKVYNKEFEIELVELSPDIEPRTHCFSGTKFLTIYMDVDDIKRHDFLQTLAHELGHYIMWRKYRGKDIFPFSRTIPRILMALKMHKKHPKFFLITMTFLNLWTDIITGRKIRQEVVANRLAINMLTQTGVPVNKPFNFISTPEELKKEKMPFFYKIYNYYLADVQRKKFVQYLTNIR